MNELPHARPMQEPIAIVGIGCRFPGGAASPDEFWDLLREGVDTLGPVPADRWDVRRFADLAKSMPGTSTNFEGGFLSEPIDCYDPAFFGISPREAGYIDPQQRILMELVWEAFEDAGLSPTAFARAAVGVYVGGFTTDTLLQHLSVNSRDAIGSHSATSATLGMLANRVSYVYDFRGPSITIDTACSSSLVAFNYACRDIWQGECEIAVAAGVNVMLRPEFPIAMTKGHFLSPTSRSQAFDAKANGYARGEGGGAVILKSLAQAQADGDRIYACVRGVGVNQDGKTPGITVPNPDAQEALISRIYSNFSIDPADIVYVEAHGTGTPVGDPIEMRALSGALARRSATNPVVPVGSVKGNIGHLEAAAGVAGIIKGALVLAHDQVPQQANFDTPNPAIPFDDYRLRVPTQTQPLAKGEGQKSVSINSFGFGGTNAHAVLGAAPEPTFTSTHTVNGPLVLPIGARSAGALSDLATAFADQIDRTDISDFSDLAGAMALRRAHGTDRLAVVATTQAEAATRLREFAAGGSPKGVVTGRTSDEATRKVTFVYTGMGPQWWAMGQQLYRENAVYRKAVDAADAAFAKHAGWSILAEMLADEDASRMTHNDIAQPANFIIQVGLTAIWKAAGVTPAACVGHSVGEVTAAYVTGALSLNDAALVSFHRSQCQQKMAGQGGMLAVGLNAEAAGELAALFPDQVSIAAINSLSSVTLAGDVAALHDIAEVLEEEGVIHKILKVEIAYHSYQMDPVKQDLKTALAGLSPRAPQIPLWSTVTAGEITGASHDADYWWQNVRQEVRFADALSDLAAAGHDLFVEIGPHPVLTSAIRETTSTLEGQAEVLHTLRRGQDETLTTAMALGQVFCASGAIDWHAKYGPTVRHVAMPSYPWQRSRHWSETEACRADRLGDGGDPLLGAALDGPDPAWQSELTYAAAGYLRDHQVGGAIVFPGAAFTQIMQAAQKAEQPESWGVIEDICFDNVLPFDVDDKPIIRTILSDKGLCITIHGRRANAQAEKWQACCTARLSKVRAKVSEDKINLDAIRADLTDIVDVGKLYDSLRARELDYGPAFRGIKSMTRKGNRFAAKITMDVSVELPDDYAFVHPTLLDSAFQAMIAGLPDDQLQAGEATFVPHRIERLHLHRPVGREMWCVGKIRQSDAKKLVGDLTLCDADGTILVQVTGMQCKALPVVDIGPDAVLDRAGYAFEWRAASPVMPAEITAERWLLMADATVLAEALAAEMSARGAIVTRALPDATPVLADRVIFLAGKAEDDPTGLTTCLQLCQLARVAQAQLTVLTTRSGLRPMTQAAHTATDQFALPGLARVIASEYPDLACRLIDIGPDPVSDVIKDLVSEIARPDTGETEVALGRDGRFVHRLTRTDLPQPIVLPPEDRPTTDPFVLEFAKAGDISSARFVAVARQAPKSGEVEFRMLETALNFKDVLKILNVLTDRVIEGTFFGKSIGMEAAIEVVRVGKDVTRFAVGDRIVTCLSCGCFRGYATVDAASVVCAPVLPEHDPAGLAAMPVVFVTAYYALRRLANLQPGERVLLHSATGGVGLAAIQIARLCGAEVYATAGNDTKRAYLQTQGVQNVYDSRSLDFADEIMRDTGGEGVDVVLNVLHGEAQQKSIGLLAPFGRFIEIGKRDIEENRGMGLAEFNRNLQFSAVDIDRMLAEKPALFDSVLQEVWDKVRAGHLAPVPVTSFPITQVAEACHALRRAEHLGKIVVSIQDLTLPIVPEQTGPALFGADSSYLVTGGLGGFGLKVAEWMAENGAGHLVLASRRGAGGVEEQSTLAALRASGASVSVHALDVSDAAAVTKLIADLEGTVPPLRGVFHAAAVLDDALLADLDDARFAGVMAPKAGGAWNLHMATQALDLDYFVLFSSVSALVGNQGQANYAAANTYLDGLAGLRRQMGLAATSINWGALADVGMAARDDQVAALLAQQGVLSLAPAVALAGLARGLMTGHAQIGIMDVDWSRWTQTNPNSARMHKFQDLIMAETDGVTASLTAALSDLTEAERRNHVMTLLARGVSEVLRTQAKELDVGLSLSQLGIDSMMVVEVQLVIERDFGIALSTMDVNRAGSITATGDVLIHKLGLDAPAEADVAEPLLTRAAE
jgi:acyl transferase domain-containing protein/acyl carrier protein